MIIKQLINKEEIWPDFHYFCLKSKPYKAFCSGSRAMTNNSIRRYFEDFCEACEVYSFQDNVFVFIREESNFNHIQFLFAKEPITNNERLSNFYAIMDHVSGLNKKYFKSEIRRTFKADFFKKWIDRYDKRAIILNNKDETVLWYNQEKMKKTLKVVATNDVSRHLQDKIASYEILSVESGSNTLISQIVIEDESYLFDAKSAHFYGDHALIEGMISDDKSFVASIALEFRP